MKATSIGGSRSRERFGVLGLGLLIVATVSVYLALRSSALENSGGATSLLPYQMLSRDLVSSDQTVFAGLQQALGSVEAVRAAAARWPDATVLGSIGSTPYTWSDVRQGLFLNYLARPTTDASAAAWLLLIQEPDPLATPDPAPNDETHHRLPDGTTLHVSIWDVPEKSRTSGFAAIPQPQNEGWTQLLMGTGR